MRQLVGKIACCPAWWHHFSPWVQGEYQLPWVVFWPQHMSQSPLTLPGHLPLITDMCRWLRSHVVSNNNGLHMLFWHLFPYVYFYYSTGHLYALIESFKPQNLVLSTCVIYFYSSLVCRFEMEHEFLQSLLFRVHSFMTYLVFLYDAFVLFSNRSAKLCVPPPFTFKNKGLGYFSL